MLVLAGEAAESNSPSATKPAPVLAGDSWAEAGRKILRLHFGRLTARAAGVVEDSDTEEVHSMRVAARRMRAAWRVFGDAYEPTVRRRMRADLRDVGHRLGRVRDMDVLLGILDEYMATHEADGLAGLHADWRATRATAHADLVAHLSSSAFARLISEYEEFLAPGATTHLRDTLAAGAEVRVNFPARAWQAYARLVAFSAVVVPSRRTDLATFHQLRIAGKWLRYTLEFARDALGPEAASLISPVVALQDHLGDQHDLDAGRQLAQGYATRVEPAAAEASAIAALSDDFDESIVRFTKHFGGIWKPLAGRRYRARMGRALTRM